MDDITNNKKQIESEFQFKVKFSQTLAKINDKHTYVRSNAIPKLSTLAFDALSTDDLLYITKLENAYFINKKWERKKIFLQQIK